MVVGTVIVLALYALLDTIISLLFNGAMWIASQIMDSSVTAFTTNSGNMVYTVIDTLLPFASSSSVVNVPSLINGVAYGIMVLVIIVGLAKSISAPLTGNDAEAPIQVVARVIIAIVLKNAIFGFGTEYITDFNFSGLLGIFGRWFGLIINQINLPEFSNIVIDSITINPVAYIGVLIMMATLLTSVLGAAISYIERLLSFALSIIVGPIAVSLYAYKDTEDVAKQWIMSIFVQFGAILMNLLLWAAFIDQINSLNADGIDFSVGNANNALLIFRLAIAVALLSVVRNCEKIFNAFGLRTMPNGDSARAVGAGIGTLGAAAMVAMRLKPAAEAGLEKGMHGSMPAMGGSHGGMASTGAVGGGNKMPFTGNTNLFAKDGKLGVGGAENMSKRAFARSGGNFGAAVTGAGSTRSAQNRQASAIGKIHEGASNARGADGQGSVIGAKLGSNTIGDSKNGEVRAKSYTGAQQANMAMNGHAGGTGFRFTGDSKGDMTFASTQSINGNTVTGIAGNAIFDNGGNGRMSNMGMYFMPTENGGASNPLAVGSQVDLGDGKQWFVTGDGVNIDDSGAMAYELRGPEMDSRMSATTVSQQTTTYNPDGSVTQSNTYQQTKTGTVSMDYGSVPEEVRQSTLFPDPYASQQPAANIDTPSLEYNAGNTIANEPSPDISVNNTVTNEQIFGDSNIFENDQFDPSDNNED